jgi:hypothetical protein
MPRKNSKKRNLSLRKNTNIRRAGSRKRKSKSKKYAKGITLNKLPDLPQRIILDKLIDDELYTSQFPCGEITKLRGLNRRYKYFIDDNLNYIVTKMREKYRWMNTDEEMQHYLTVFNADKSWANFTNICKILKDAYSGPPPRMYADLPG